MDDLKQAIIRYANLHANADGLAVTPIPGLRMMCAPAPSGPMWSIYKPLVCLVLQGAKQMTIGVETGEFSAGQSVLVTLDMPVTGRITQASRDRPYLALAVELDAATINEIVTELGLSQTQVQGPNLPLFVDDTDAATLECAVRLMRLLDRPEAAPVLRPAIMKELHYWLLAGRHGASLRSLTVPDGDAQRIAAAVKILRAEFDRPISVHQLAASSGMSVSTFHRRFKAMTSLTPIQFQKQLRLIEARRLMLTAGQTASRAAFEVGYESVSQFTREYARLFGAPPHRDTRGQTKRRLQPSQEMLSDIH
jgi:AraC-like DNA-binding protein